MGEKLRSLLLVLFLISLVSVGCSEQQKPIDKLDYQIELNKTNFTLDDEIVITATVTNISNADIQYITIGNNDQGIGFAFKNEQQWRFVEKDNNLEQENDKEPKEHLLKPDEQIKVTKTYLPKVNMGMTEDQIIPAPTGNYKILVMLQTKNIVGIPPTEKEIQIEGGEQIISIIKAKEIFKKSKEGKAWLGNHTGDAISKQDGNIYYLKENGKWIEVEENAFVNALKNTPVENINFRDMKWNINYKNYLGDSPHEITAVIDAITGEIIETTTK